MWLKLFFIVVVLLASAQCDNITTSEDFDYGDEVIAPTENDVPPEITVSTISSTIIATDKQRHTKKHKSAKKKDTDDVNDEKNENQTISNVTNTTLKKVLAVEIELNLTTSTTTTTSTSKPTPPIPVKLTKPMTTTSVEPTTSTTTSTSAPPLPTILATTSTIEDSSDYKTASFFKGFNLNYLYFLLLLIPISGIVFGMFYYFKIKKKRGDYMEPVQRPNKTRRLSTPSWVFSEPDFDDEEVITLEEEKKK